MKLRIVVGALFLVSCIAAGAADRKFVVKPRAADMKALPFSDGVWWAILFIFRATLASTQRPAPHLPALRTRLDW